VFADYPAVFYQSGNAVGGWDWGGNRFSAGKGFFQTSPLPFHLRGNDFVGDVDIWGI
jgi:hypothetical protein